LKPASGPICFSSSSWSPTVIVVPNPPVSFGHRNDNVAMPKNPRNAVKDAVAARFRNCRRETAS
jgi:hypothetical protein